MNGRRLFVNFAKHRGCDAVSFIKVEDDYYNEILHYLDSNTKRCKLNFTYQEVFKFILMNYELTPKNNTTILRVDA